LKINKWKRERKRKLAMWNYVRRKSRWEGVGGEEEGNLPSSFTLTNINLHPTQHTKF
jgi:hypothetical protein